MNGFLGIISVENLGVINRSLLISDRGNFVRYGYIGDVAILLVLCYCSTSYLILL